MSVIITCNAGSSNIKLAAFDDKTLTCIHHTIVQHHTGAIASWLRSIGKPDISAIGHRVVHGGTEFFHPTLITSNVLRKLKAYTKLAPLHQPQALKLIAEAQKLYPEVPQIGCFDTGFHHTMPYLERRLPLPRRFHEQGILRYGFHGLSYQSIASALPHIAGQKAHGRVIAVHLGGGASACAMKELKSIASTMGFSTLDGLMMSTRPGALDSGIILYLLQQKKMTAKRICDLLYHQSGLKGVSGISSDMQTLLKSKKPAARDAVTLYCQLAAKQIASLLPALGGLDMLVFTGGIGEHAASVREDIVSRLRYMGDFPVYIIPADEEKIIAEACSASLKRL